MGTSAKIRKIYYALALVAEDMSELYGQDNIEVNGEDLRDDMGAWCDAINNSLLEMEDFIDEWNHRGKYAED